MCVKFHFDYGKNAVFSPLPGTYGDQVNEMAWAVEEVLQTLKELHVDQDTLTVFISDHGPHTEICGEGGSPGFFRGRHLFLSTNFVKLRHAENCH